MTNQRPLGVLGELVQTDFLDRERFAPSRRHIAVSLGVSPSTIGNWLEGISMPTPDNLRALSKFTRISYDRLLEAALADTGYRELPPGLAARRKKPGK